MKIAFQYLARLLLLLFVLAPTVSMAGFSIQNGQLVDNNGVPFMMRGISYPYTWFQSQPTQQHFAAMSATGANTVRIVLSTGGVWARIPGAQVTQLIQWAKDNRMIALLEVHDSTGWSEQGGAVPISNAVAYWTSADIRAAINGQENFVIINIANEPFGNTTNANFVPDTSAAIQALRTAGLTHTLMIDAANWGQDWSNTMRNNAMQLWNADPNSNLLFSVHMYEVYATAAPIIAYMQTFDDLALPLVIGEFGPYNNNVDIETIFTQAQQRGNGYLGWSWSGNSSDGVVLDIVQNFSTTFSPWGNRLVNGTNGIRATSVRASVFPEVGNNLVVSPTTLSLSSAAASSPVTVTGNVGWTVTDDQTWLSVAAASGTGNGSFTVSATANTATTNRSGTVTVTGGGITRLIAVTQAAGQTTNTLTVAPTSLSLAAAASSATIAVTANLSWTVTDDQSWLSVSPMSGTNNGSVTVSAIANTGTASRTGTVTVTGGGISRAIAVTQAGQGPPTGSVTATGAVTNSSGWFTEEQLRLSNTASITALSVTITVQRTTGVSAAGQYNTLGGTVSQSNSSTATAITYVFSLSAGQTLSPAANRTFAVQIGGNGTVHPTAGDTYSVSGTAGGQAFTLTGTF